MVAPLAYLAVNIASEPEQVAETLTSGRTGELLVATVALAVAVTVSATALGTATAWVTVRTDLRHRRLWFTLLALPLVIPSYVGALAYVAAFGRGMVAEVLGIDRLPDITGFPGAWLALTVFTYPTSSWWRRRCDGRTARSRRRRAAWAPRRPGCSAPSSFPGSARRWRQGDAGGALHAVRLRRGVLMRYDAFTRAIYAQFAGRPNRYLLWCSPRC